MNFLLDNWLLVLVAFSSGVALLLPNLHTLGAPGLSPTQAVLLINREKANIVDVRDADEPGGDLQLYPRLGRVEAGEPI